MDREETILALYNYLAKKIFIPGIWKVATKNEQNIRYFHGNKKRSLFNYLANRRTREIVFFY